jgi:hypothetical protein
MIIKTIRMLSSCKFKINKKMSIDIEREKQTNSIKKQIVMYTFTKKKEGRKIKNARKISFRTILISYKILTFITFAIHF